MDEDRWPEKYTILCYSNPVVKAGTKAVGVKNYADASATMDDVAVLRMMSNWGKRKVVGRPSVPSGVTVTVRIGFSCFSICQCAVPHEVRCTTQSRVWLCNRVMCGRFLMRCSSFEHCVT